MAHKDHSLDDKIAAAAREEFLEKGYSGASLRKIAEKAGATVGAIRTRYRSKDELFACLVKPFLDMIGALFQSTKADYYSGAEGDFPAGLKAAADGTDRKYIWAVGYENDENAVLFATDDLSRKKETEAYIALYIAERRQPVEWIACYATEKPGVLDLLPYYLARALPTLDIRNLKTIFLDTNGAGEPLCYRLEDFLPDELIGRLSK